MKVTALALCGVLLLSGLFCAVAAPQGTDSQESSATISHVCDELPTGNVSDEELKRLVPDGSPGRVRIRWKTETQDDTYGFNVYRADGPDKPFRKINPAIIPGEGSTNIPRDYCYLDQGVEREKTYLYYIEEVTNQGTATKIEATMGADGKGTRVRVKSVPEEREWIRRKALGLDTGTSASVVTTPTKVRIAATPAQIQRIKPQSPGNEKPNESKPKEHLE